MISDILIILLIIFFAFLGYKRGLASTLLNFAAVIASSIISRLLANGLAHWIYDSFIKQSVINRLQTTIDTYGVDTAVNTSLNSAPDWITGLIKQITGLFGVTINDVQNGIKLPEDKTLSVVQSIEQPVGELTVGIISLLMSTVFFIIILVLLKILVRKALRVFEIPVISQINHILGTFTGLIEGIVIVLIAVNIFSVVVITANPNALNNSSFYGSLFNFFCFFK